ncbi:uncharacterized protein KQ657_004864 [Scheffersomyces spartinae]|uniref:Uncharacterized protein n=1 Tax=Scheffersomyces spartinae TaxID=45513 RepID=A0A9P7V9Z6_9ASCO|nr:uncharacterized protein KQ657_004864 [Scheffersomyces spartinae]KAG7194156.1 hypothetical protein KQ657_004864 [Scheffersomyces spartinae]
MKDLQSISQVYDISVFGKANSGKSSLIQRYIHGKFIGNVDPTVQDLYTKYRGPDLHPITILDTVNIVEEYSTSGKSQVRHCRGFMYVYSVTSRETFEYVEELHNKLQYLLGAESTTPPIVLVGSMCDLEMERQVSTLEGKEMAERIGAMYFHEASSLWGTSVTEAFEPLVSHSASQVKDDHPTKIISDSHPREILSLQQMLLSPVVSLNDLSATKVDTYLDKTTVKLPVRTETDASIETTVSEDQKTESKESLSVRNKQSRPINNNSGSKKKNADGSRCCVIM